MHPRVQELLDHLDRHHQRLLRAIDQIPPSLRGQSPGPDRWSVGEVMQHLALVETRLARTLADRTATARAEGVGPDPDLSPILATLDFAPVLNRETRIAAPAVAIPVDRIEPAAALQELDRAHRALREAVRASDGINLGTITAPHPVFGPMNLYRWIANAGAHESRHAAQVAEIGGALNAAPGSA